MSTIKAGSLSSSGPHSSASPSFRQGIDGDPSPINAGIPYASPASAGAYSYPAHSHQQQLPPPPPPPGTMPGYTTGRNPSGQQVGMDSMTGGGNYPGQHSSRGLNPGNYQSQPSRALAAGHEQPMRGESFSSTSSGHGLTQGVGNQAFNTSHTRGSIHNVANTSPHFHA